MERFAALVTGHRAAPVPGPASAAKVEAKRKGKVVEEDAAYLSIHLEEIVIVKNDDDASLGPARGRSTLTSGASTSMGRQRAAAVAAPPSGMTAAAAAAAAARGATSTTAGWIVGSDDYVGRVGELRSRVFA